MKLVKKSIGLAGLLTLTGLTAAVCQAQNLVTNPSFEAGSTTNFTADNWTFNTTSPTAGAPLAYIPDGGYPVTVPDPSRLLIFNAGGNVFTGTATQTLATTIGTTYNVVLNVGVFAEGTAGRNQRLLITASDASPAFSQLVPVTSVSGTATLPQYSYTFVAGSATTTLTLADATTGLSNSSFSDLLVDNVRVTVAPVNTAPVAVNDSYNAILNTPLVISAPGVLTNDTDAESNPLTAVVDTVPAHGTLTLNPNGGFTYTPTTGYIGADSFTYHASDGLLSSNVATVSLTVSAPPLVTNGSFELGSPADFGTLTGWTITGTGSFPPSGYSTHSPSHVATEGTRLALFNTGGNIFDGTISQAITTVIGQTYTLTYQLGITGTSGKKQRLLASAVGNASLLSESREITSTSNTNSTWALQTLSFTADSTTTTLTLADNSGTLSGTNGQASDLLLDDVKVVAAAGNSPPVASADSYTATQNLTLNISVPGVLSNDTDAQSDPLTAVLNVGPTHGSLTLNSNGSFSYTPTTGYTGADSFTYRANDGVANSGIVTVSITVNAPASLTNGGFELGSPADFGTLTGWTITGTGSFPPSGYSEHLPAYNPEEGIRLALFNAGGNIFDGTISQSISTTPGQAYTLTYKLGITGTLGKKQKVLVTAVGNTTLVSVPEEITALSGTASTWALKTVNFTADSNTTLLTFADNSGTLSGTNAQQSDLLLDDVAIALNTGNTAPSAVADSYATTQNLTLNVSAPGVLSNDTDAQSDPLTAVLDTTVSHGSLTLNSNGSFTYVPTTGYTGADSFTYHANDGSLNSSIVTVSIAVNAPSNNKVTNGSFETGSPADFGALTGWTITGTNTAPPFAPVGYTTHSPGYVATQGTRLALFNAGGNTFDGTISQTFPTTVGQSYTLTFQLGITGTLGRVQSVQVSATGASSLITGPNGLKSVTSNSNTASFFALQTITFVADSTSTTLTFADASSSANGTTSDLLLDDVQVVETLNVRLLTVTSSPSTGFAVTVSPADLSSNSNGVTNFTRNYQNLTDVTLTATAASGANVFQKWQKNGIDAGTNPAITVNMDANHTMNAVYVIDNTPRSTADSYTIAEDADLSVPAPGVLSNDVEPNALPMTAVLDTTTTNGILTLNANGSFDYDPASNFHGTDSFTYHATNGTFNSPVTTVTITVTPVNDAPVADGQTLSTDEDVALPVTLTGSDPDGTTPTFAVVAQPQHGTLSGTSPNLTYTPAANYHGADSFTYKANDGTADSPIATVSLNIAPLPDVPVANNLSVSLTGGTSLAIVLAGSDADGDTLTYSISTGPTHGTLSGTGANRTYTPVANYVGSDSFTYIVNDGTSDSAVGTVSITVTDVLLNGSFEQVTGLVPNNWTVSGNYEIATSGSYPGRNAQDGTRLAVFNGGNLTPNAIFSQTFATTPGQPYILYFDIGATGDTRQQRLRVTLTGSSQLKLQEETITGPGGTASIWSANRSVTFTPNSATTTLQLRDITTTTNGNITDLLLDKVRVVPQVTRVLSVASTHVSAVPVTVSPADLNAAANGTTAFSRTYLDNTVVNLTVPVLIGSDHFVKWQRNGVDFSTTAATSVTLSSAYTMTAVYAANQAPVATADSYSTNEDVQLVVAAPGVLSNDTDPEALPITAALDAGPANGTLVFNPNGSFTYTPTGNYNGSDSFTYHTTDGLASSSITTVSLTVNPVNDAPSATAQSVTVAEDGSVGITLTGSDIDLDMLSFTTGSPSNGTLSGTAPNLTYTPNANYNGSDSFTFTVNDGTVSSAPATVSITVNPVNDAPSAIAQSVTVAEDGSVAITLTGSDIDGNPLSFNAGFVSNGTLSGTAPNLTYTPNANYHGSDSFSFTVADGIDASTPATVSITVSPVNDAPTATAQSVTVAEDGSVAITLTGSDIDLDTLSYTAGSATNGTLSGTAPNLTYTPNANYNGSDSFTFTVNDGTVNSTPATVSITVSPVNDAPSATAQSVTVAEDGSVAITLTGSDIDLDTLSFTAGSATNGTLSGTAPNLTYTPNANYNGADSFSFTVNDGTVSSAPATVSITVSPVNDGPSATAQSVTVAEDGSVAITLTGSDIDLDTLSFTAGSATNGILSGTAPNLTYTPNANYNGADSFSFTVNDGTVSSAPATVSITVSPVNDAPSATAQSVTVAEDGSVAITLTGSDIDLDTLSFTAGSATNGILSGTAPNLTYTPNANYNGADSFTFTVNDGTVNSTPATVSITITPREEFGQWLESFGLSAGPLVDSDGDSIRNSLEYVIGGNPATVNNVALLPTASIVTADPDNNLVNESYLLFTYRRTDLANTDPSTAIKVEWDTDLAGVWTNVIGTAGVVTLVEDNAAIPSTAPTDLVRVYIPRSLAVNGKLFARLRVEVAVP
jgi:large repetitive protein